MSSHAKIILNLLHSRRVHVALVLFVIAFVVWFLLTPLKHGQIDRMHVVFPNGTVIEALLADTQEERRVGLGDIEHLPENHGMLFLFDTPTVQTFWMKDVEYAIDILWLVDNTIVGFEQDVPPDPGEPRPNYVSPKPVNRVLELSAGFVQEQGVEVGDVIEIMSEDL